MSIFYESAISGHGRLNFLSFGVQNMKVIQSKPTFGRFSQAIAASTVLILGSLLLAAQASAGLVNLALNKPATASSTWDTPSYQIAYGNDGNPNTPWNGGTHIAWWQVDLGSVRSIDHITVTASDGPNYHMTFQVSWSTDGSNWTIVNPSWSTGTGTNWSFTFPMFNVAMRYVRYQTLGDAGSDWAGLGELEAIGDSSTVVAAPAPVPTLSDWAQYTIAFMLLFVGGWYLRRAKPTGGTR